MYPNVTCAACRGRPIPPFFERATVPNGSVPNGKTPEPTPDEPVFDGENLEYLTEEEQKKLTEPSE